MGEQILKLRSEGKTYNEIVEIVGCSKGTVSFHCGEGQKEKGRQRQQRNRTNKSLSTRVYAFQKKVANDKFKTKVATFKSGGEKHSERFNTKDVLAKISENPTCSLTGREIDLEDTSSYHLDHIIPTSRGGDNSLENLALCRADANLAKRDLTNKEFYFLCKEVVKHLNKNYE